MREGNGQVQIAFLHKDVVSYSWVDSMRRLIKHDTEGPRRLTKGGEPLNIRCSTGQLVPSRNYAVSLFLDKTGAEWLFFIDTDMGFLPDTVDQLLKVADPATTPVVGALCFAQHFDGYDRMGGLRTRIAPTLYRIGQQAKTGFHTFSYFGEYPLDEVVPVAVTGMACILIHRSALERIRVKDGDHWFDQVATESGAVVGEDFSFCLRLGALGIPVHVHTGVPTTHHKEVWLGEEDYLAQLMADAVDPQALTESIATARNAFAKAWTVPRYAIVPTRDRPARLLALVYALSNQCDQIIVLDNGSNPPVDVGKLEFAAGAAKVTVIRDEEQPPNLGRFFNIMFDECDRRNHQEQWDVAVLNDDAIVPAGWYDACAEGLRAEGSTAMIAHTALTSPRLLTEIHNDPGNRMCPHAFVMRGEARMRADETLRWWFNDTDLDLRARQAGGVLSVEGPIVVNAHANQSTVGALANQAQGDYETFVAKWGELS